MKKFMLLESGLFKPRLSIFLVLALYGGGGVFADEPETTILPIEVPPGVEEKLDASTSGEVLQLDKVVLEEDSSLVIEDFKSIRIRELVAKDGARIRLLQKSSGGDGGAGSRAGDGASARLFLEDLKGHLLVEARGGDGGRGVDGKNGRQGLDGKDGRRARTLFFGIIYLGNGEDGHTGEPGEDGEAGGDGGDGGNGGTIAVYFNSKSSFANVVVDVDGGAGGMGGRGGRGGLGGDGGRGGAGLEHGKAGLNGRPGRPGVSGKPGKPGKPGRAYVYQPSKALFDCLSHLEARLDIEDLTETDINECRAHQTPSERSALSISSSTPASVVTEVNENEFHLNADGQSGQSSVDALVPGLTPADASSGASGGFLTIVLRELPVKAVISAQGGRGGDGGRGANGFKGKDGQDGRNANAFRKATRGENAGDGGAAGHGSNGGDGGTGGTVRLVYLIDETSQFDPNWRSRFQIYIHGGDGGRAGEGGAGGRAGKGGKGGIKLWMSKRLANGIDGKKGADGLAGKEGRAGEDGKVEFIEARTYSDWIVDEFVNQTRKYFSARRDPA